jgi:drug/metabolite transporter (DMT)-like permease
VLGSELATLTGCPLGTLFMLGAAAAWGLGTQLMRRRGLPGAVVVLTFWMLLMALVVSGAIAWATERAMWVRWPDTIEWSAIAHTVFLVFGVSQLLWFRLASILPPVASSLSVMLIPVVGLFSGMALLGEQPTWHDRVALGCVLAAIASLLLPARRAAAWA